MFLFLFFVQSFDITLSQAVNYWNYKVGHHREHKLLKYRTKNGTLASSTTPSQLLLLFGWKYWSYEIYSQNNVHSPNSVLTGASSFGPTAGIWTRRDIAVSRSWLLNARITKIFWMCILMTALPDIQSSFKLSFDRKYGYLVYQSV